MSFRWDFQRWLLTVFLFGIYKTDSLVAAEWSSGHNYEAGVIFVAPGAGGDPWLEENLKPVLERARVPLRVARVNWNHGIGDISRDIKDRANHHEAGAALARAVLNYRRYNPHGKIYMLSHSAGGAVLLSAASRLPPDAVDRIVMLAPGVSSRYDLRQALRASSGGIDVYYSRGDNALDFFVDVIGTTEGRGTLSAGQIGFTPVVESPEDAHLYRKLRQHPWRSEYADRGYYGGHFGLVRKPFLYHYVLPQLLAP